MHPFAISSRLLSVCFVYIPILYYERLLLRVFWLHYCCVCAIKLCFKLIIPLLRTPGVYNQVRYHLWKTFSRAVKWPIFKVNVAIWLKLHSIPCKSFCLMCVETLQTQILKTAVLDSVPTY